MHLTACAPVVHSLEGRAASDRNPYAAARGPGGRDRQRDAERGDGCVFAEFSFQPNRRVTILGGARVEPRGGGKQRQARPGRSAQRKPRPSAIAYEEAERRTGKKRKRDERGGDAHAARVLQNARQEGTEGSE